MARKKTSQKIRPASLFLLGGGSGGHVTPLISLAKEIKKSKLNWRLVYIGSKKDKVARQLIADQVHLFESVVWLPAGKLRRFKGYRGWRRYKQISQHGRNLIDLWAIFRGIFAALILFGRQKPDLVFSKGGFSALAPLLAARFWRRPVVIHDSDAVLSLTHKLVKKTAKLRLIGLPGAIRTKERYVGVPISSRFQQKITLEKRAKILAGYNLPAEAEIILVFGGSLGAVAINRAIVGAFDQFKLRPNSHFILLTGVKNYQAVQEQVAAEIKEQPERLTIKPFLASTDLVDLIMISQIAIIRAGATSLAEVTAAGLPTIIIPKPFMPGNHQIKNANVYRRAEAAVIVSDNGRRVSRRALISQINQLLDDPSKRQELRKNIRPLGKQKATEETLAALREVLAGRIGSSLAGSSFDRRQYFANRLVVGYQQPKAVIKTNARLKRQKKLSHWQTGLALLVLLATLVFFRLAYIGSVNWQAKPSVLINQEDFLEIQNYFNQEILPETNPLNFASWWQRRFNFPTTSVSEQLKERWPIIEKIEVDRQLLTSEITLQLSFKKVVGVLEKEENKQALLPDGSLVDLSNITTIDPNVLQISLAEGANPNLTAAEAGFIEEFRAYFDYQKRPVSRLKISQKPKELIFNLSSDQDLDIITIANRDPIAQAIVANASLNCFGDKTCGQNYPKEYIDVRLVTQVVYK